MKKILGLIFLITWMAGEAPRLWWGAAWPVRPMDVAAGLIFLVEVIGNKRYKNYKNIGLIVAAAILGPYALRTLVYGWLIWRGGDIFAPVRRWIVPALAAFLVLGLGQYLFLPDMRFLLQYGWDEHYYRLVGTVLDPNYFGVMAGMILLYSTRVSHRLSRWRKFARSPFPTLRREPQTCLAGRRAAAVSLANLPTSIAGSVRNLWLVISKTPSSIRLLGLLSFITMILTFSRASWVAFGAAAGWWGILGVSGRSGPPSLTSGLLATIRRRPEERLVGGLGVPADFSDEKSGYVRRRLGRLGILGILGILGLGIWWLAPKPGGEGVNLMRTSSIEQRLVSWNQAIEAWKQHPWAGTGFNNYGVGSREYGAGKAPSSSWLLILEATGILGSAGTMMGAIWVIREIRGDRFWMAMAIMVGVHAIFNNTLFYPPVLGLLALIRAAR